MASNSCVPRNRLFTPTIPHNLIPKKRSNNKKWADYLISGVGYEPPGVIEKVMRHKDMGATVGEGKLIARSTMVADLKGFRKKSYMTIGIHISNKWSKGKEIHSKKRDGVNWIRIKGVGFQKRDSLGDLHCYNRCANFVVLEAWYGSNGILKEAKIREDKRYYFSRWRRVKRTEIISNLNKGLWYKKIFRDYGGWGCKSKIILKVKDGVGFVREKGLPYANRDNLGVKEYMEGG